MILKLGGTVQSLVVCPKLHLFGLLDAVEVAGIGLLSNIGESRFMRRNPRQAFVPGHVKLFRAGRAQGAWRHRGCVSAERRHRTSLKFDAAVWFRVRCRVNLRAAAGPTARNEDRNTKLARVDPAELEADTRASTHAHVFELRHRERH